MTQQDKKIKVMIISDHYSASSGVANQTRYVVNTQHKSGKFSFVYLGGGIKHADNNPIKYQEFGDDLIQYPVEGYGNPDIVRTIMKKHKPDILWYMSDPRFYEWLHAMENEIRVKMPMVWYTIWDNYPAPKYNRKFYECNDLLVPISKVTDNILKEVAPNTPRVRIPHTVDHDIFKKKWAENKITGQPVPIKEALMPENKDKFMVFFNSRNARRKLSGTLIFWFKEFLDRVGHENAFLLMHTDPKDPNGQDLDVILRDLELKNRQVLFSTEILNSNQLADLYNAADVTACISHSEGFGISSLESQACETPVISTKTGGLQEQITDGKKVFGVALNPVSKPIVGSQQVPYIYEDLVCKEDFVNGLMKLYKLWKKDPVKYAKIGENGRKHVLKNMNKEDFDRKWVEVMLDLHERCGSWETRKGYIPWEMKKL